MRVLFPLVLSLFLCDNVYSQGGGFKDATKLRNAEMVIRGFSSQLGRSLNISVPLKPGKGMFIFNDWDLNGVFYLLNGSKFNAQNVNFNVSTNQFQAKIDNLNYFVFDSEQIDRVEVENKSFIRKYSRENGGYRFYELLIEGEFFSIYKDLTIKLQSEDVSYGVTESKVRQSLKTTYYIQRNNNKISFRPNMKGIGKIFSDRRAELKDFVKSQGIKVRTDEDIKRIALHYIQITK